MADDLFACFDDNNDERDDGQYEAKRDPECGVLKFHNGTERSLLLYVENHSMGSTPQAVRNAVDKFCLQRHWMMHVGPHKSLQLASFLNECVAFRRSTKTSRFVVLELGTYCGYSSILWAETLQTLGIEFHVYTVEANPHFVEVARGLIKQSGMESFISVLYLDVLGKNQKICELMTANSISDLDFVFLDHDKDSYLDDLQELEAANLVRTGVYVAADNVLFARIDSYRRYIQNLADRGIVQTRLEHSWLEYSELEQSAAADPSVYYDGIGTY